MFKHINNFIVLFLVIWTFSTVNSQNTVYYNQYKSWSPELENIANNSNNAMAIEALGSCYDRGDGVPRDTIKAFELFSRAAELGDVLALYNLAWYQYKGYSTGRNYIEAEKNLLKVIEHNPNFKPAYLILADIYEEGGDGIKSNYSKAFELFSRAAELGDCFSLFKMGTYHENGLLTGTPNFHEALKLYLQVKDYWESYVNPAGYVSYKIAEYYLYGRGVDVDLDKAISYYNESLRYGFSLSYMNLATAYNKKGDLEQCFQSLLTGYEKGIMEVCNNLGDCYYSGRGTEQSYKKAYEIFEIGAKSCPICKYRQSMMLRKGEGVKQDLQKANMLLEESAQSGFGKAQYILGCDLYENKYYSKAIEYFEEALNGSISLIDEIKGDICRKLSICYRFGRGVKTDENKANEYNQKAASYGEPNSQIIEDWLHQL